MSSHHRPTIRLAGFVLILGLLAVPPARAGIMIPETTVVPVGNPVHKYTFHVVLTADSQVNTGDYFTVYDFLDLVDGTNTQPPDWTFATGFIGLTPGGLSVDDDPDLPNVTWIYSGATPLVGPRDLGDFSVISRFKMLDPFDYSQQSHKITGGFDRSVGTTTPRFIPEPASLVLMGLGLVGLACVSRRQAR